MRQVFCYKMRQFYYKMPQLLQNAKILLQNAAVIIKCDVYYKSRQHIQLCSQASSSTLKWGDTAIVSGERIQW